MLLTQQHLRRVPAPNLLLLLPPPSLFPLSHPLKFPSPPTKHCGRCSSRKIWMARAAQLSEEPTTTTATPEGPIELPPSTSPLFATGDDPTPLQTATSVLLTGAITVLLFRSLRRRAKRAKETVYSLSLSRDCLSSV